MGWIQGAIMAAGGGLALAGQFQKRTAAKIAQNRMKRAIAEPGVNIGDVTDESLDNILNNMDASSTVSSRTNLANQRSMDEVLNASIPGYSEIQQKRSNLARSYLAGELPPDVIKAIQRSSAGRTLGYGGGSFHSALTARDLGLTSLDLMGRGDKMSQDLISGTPRATFVGAEKFFGPDPTQLTDLRSKERTEKLKMMEQLAGMPGGSAVWGDGFRWAGEQVMSMGSSMMGQGMGKAAS